MKIHKIYQNEKWNIYMIILSYFFNNCVSGVVYDIYINYLQEVDLEIAKSFWSYYGYSTFLSAFLITFINKVGYKKILLFSVGSCTVGLFGSFLTGSSFLVRLSVLFILNGVQLHYLILLPFINKYTRVKEQVKWFSRVYYIGYVGFFIFTYLGGYLTIKLFAKNINFSYLEAKRLTNALGQMDFTIKNIYISSMRELLTLLGIISIIGILPILFIKEKKEDYILEKDNNKGIIKEIYKNRKYIFNRDSILYCVYWGLNNFAIGLFVPYYTIYLNRDLGIDKVTTSLIISLSYIAVVIFIFFTDIISNKIGRIKTLYTSIFLAIPFMIIVAEGARFNQCEVWVVGIALFLRTGLMNLGSPIDSSLAVEVVEEKLVPMYTGVISIITGVAGILSGQFTGNILFNLSNGYKLGYYLGAFLYLLGAIILVVNFSKFDKQVKLEG